MLLDRPSAACTGWAVQFLRYGAVGLSNTLVSFAVYSALVGLRAAPTLAASVAFADGAANGYRRNRRWTFAAARRSSLVRYGLVQGAGLLATAAFVAALDGPVGPLAAFTAATGAVTAATFAANRRWTFGGR